MVQNFEYSITDLENETGQNRRTIHFYIQQGVIPPPLGVGGGAKYSEEHLLRLKLIPILQQSHLKLSGVKLALDGMDIAQMRRMIREPGKVVNVRTDSPIRMRLRTDPNMAPTARSESAPDETADLTLLSYAQLVDNLEEIRSTDEPRGPQASRRPTSSRPSQWRRIELADGIELHVRSDHRARYQSVILQVMRLFGKLLK